MKLGEAQIYKAEAYLNFDKGQENYLVYVAGLDRPLVVDAETFGRLQDFLSTHDGPEVDVRIRPKVELVLPEKP